MIGLIRRAIDYLRDTDVDIRTRLLFLVEYAALCACLIGTVTMLMFTTTFIMMLPNIILLVMCIAGLLFSHIGKNYKLAANLFIIGCAFISLPIMFFTAGGNRSGMVLWFLFGGVFCCVISKGKSRVIMPLIMIVISGNCMLIGHYHPEFVISLENENAEFFDTFQSFLVVSVMLFATLCAYLYTYDIQSKMLIEQKEELKKIVYTDSLTQIANRHAYYEEIASYKEIDYKENLVVVAMDVNGLKTINDTEGHAAGDSLIKCAADAIDAAYGKLGNVYRTGGDEFVGILFCDDSRTEKLRDILKESICASAEAGRLNMSIALGIAAWNREKGKSFFELEKLADSRMYQDKNDYYRSMGIDRRKN